MTTRPEKLVARRVPIRQATLSRTNTFVPPKLHGLDYEREPWNSRISASPEGTSRHRVTVEAIFPAGEKTATEQGPANIPGWAQVVTPVMGRMAVATGRRY
jgi:hypothetical protein